MEHQYGMILKAYRITSLTRGLFLLFFVFSFSPATPLSAQSAGGIVDKSIIMQKIRELRSGVLIVRLESDRRKMEALERLSNDPGLAEKEKARIEGELAKAREEAALKTTGYVEAFRDAYDYSDVVFMYDYQTRAYQEGQITFFDASFKEVPGATVLDRAHLILSEGISENNGARMLEFLSENLEPLGKPAPRSHFGVLSFVTTTGLRVSRINRKLHRLAR